MPLIKADYCRNSWNFIREKRYTFCRRHSKSKKILSIRSRRGPTSLHVQHSIIVICRFLSRWKHVDDQSEYNVLVSWCQFSVLRLSYARHIMWWLRAVAVPPVSGYLPVLWRARVVMSTCCTETNAHAHRAFRCNGFFCSYDYNHIMLYNIRVAIFTIVLLVT